jgi:hypothetical protein
MKDGGQMPVSWPSVDKRARQEPLPTIGGTNSVSPIFGRETVRMPRSSAGQRVWCMPVGHRGASEQVGGRPTRVTRYVPPYGHSGTLLFLR